MPGSAGSGEGAFSCADTEPIIFLLSRRIDPATRPPAARAGASRRARHLTHRNRTGEMRGH